MKHCFTTKILVIHGFSLESYKWQIFLYYPLCKEQSLLKTLLVMTQGGRSGISRRFQDNQQTYRNSDRLRTLALPGLEGSAGLCPGGHIRSFLLRYMVL